MQTYEFYIEDDRYSVPTLMFAEASTEGQARGLAVEQMCSSPHYRRMCVYLGDQRLFSIGESRLHISDRSDSMNRPA